MNVYVIKNHNAPNKYNNRTQNSDLLPCTESLKKTSFLTLNSRLILFNICIQRLLSQSYSQLRQAAGQGFGVGEEGLDGQVAEAGPFGDAFGLLPGDEVGGAVGVGVDQQGGTNLQGGFFHGDEAGVG